MVREYIGARYVPKFMGPYDATQEYEALCVVDNGAGTTYISKIPTPAGTPLNNTTYWMVYGASSGAIIDLQNRMSAAENELNKKAAERNIIVIGNSYVDRGCANPLIANFAHGYKVTSGGIGFLQYSGHTDTFETMIDNAIIDATIDNDTITDVIFVSAMGDTRAYQESASDFINGLNTTFSSIMSKIQTNFPNCAKVSITLAETRSVWGWSNNHYDTIFKVHKTFKDLSNTYGINYIGWSGFNSLFNTANVDSDNYHPTTVGALSIGSWIESAYFGNAEYVHKTAFGSVDFKYCSGGKITALYDFTPDVVNVQLRRATVTQNAPVTIAQNDELIDFSSLSIPLPPPVNSINFFAPLIRSDTGVQADMLTIELKANSDGVAHVDLVSVPNASTVLATYLTLVGTNAFSYHP